MLRRDVWSAIMVGWVGLWIAVASLAAEEIKLDALPKPVKATLKKRYPKAELTRAAKELDDDDVEFFHISLTNDKKQIEIALGDDGAVHWISVKLPAQKLPKPVSSALQKEYPQSKVTSATEIYNVREGKDTLEYYDIELTTKTNEQRILNIEPDGSIVVDEVVETNTAELPPPAPKK